MTLHSLESFYNLAFYLALESPKSLFGKSDAEGMQMVDIGKLPRPVLDLRSNLRREYASSLHMLLRQTLVQKATDPRDKIYGLLGLSSDFRSGGICPRYDYPVREVFLDVVKSQFQKYDSLDILDHCAFQHTGKLGLPSWVPNWVGHAEAAPVPKYFVYNNHEPRPVFDAYGGLSLSSRPWSFGEANSLRLTGACFDTIASVTEMADFRNGWTLETLLEAWMPTVPTAGAKYPFAPGTWQEARRTTIVVDCRSLPSERGVSMVFPDDPDSKEQALLSDRLNEARWSSYEACVMKRLAYTSKGLMGLVRQETKVGDSVAVLAGSKVLHCLRQVEETKSSGDQRYHLIGEAYFRGIMDGEIMEGLELGDIILV